MAGRTGAVKAWYGTPVKFVLVSGYILMYYQIWGERAIPSLTKTVFPLEPITKPGVL
jgi:hypothetical protein